MRWGQYCMHVSIISTHTHIWLYSVSGAIFAQVILGGKIIKHSACCEQVATIGNFITQDYSCVS